MLEVKEINEQIAAKKAQYQKLASQIESEGRSDDCSDEEICQFSALDNEIAQLEKRRVSLEATAKSKTLVAQSFSSPAQSSRHVADANDQINALRCWGLMKMGHGADCSPRMRDSFARAGWDLNQPGFSFDQTAGTTTSSGNLLPSSILQGIVTRLVSFGGLFALADVLNTPGDSNPLHFVPVDDTSNSGGLVANEVSSGHEVSNTTLTNGAKLTMTGYDIATGIFPIGRQLLRNVGFDLVSYMNNAISIRLQRAMNSYWVNGTGSSQPEGYVYGQTQLHYSASDAGFDYDDLVDLEDKIDPDYRDGAVYMMHPKTWSYIKKQIADSGWPSAEFGFTAMGTPQRTLNGYGVVLNSQFPQIGADNKAIVFGNPKSAFTIRMSELKMVQSSELYWKSQALALAGWAVTDSKVTNPYASAALVTGTEE